MTCVLVAFKECPSWRTYLHLSIMGHGVIASSQAQLMVDPKSIVSQALGTPPNRSPIQSVQLPTVHSQTSFLVGVSSPFNYICCCGAGSVDQWHPAPPGYLWQGGNPFMSLVACHGVARNIYKGTRCEEKHTKMHKYHHQHKQYAYVYIHTAFSRFLHTLLIPDSLETMQPLLASCIGLWSSSRKMFHGKQSGTGTWVKILLMEEILHHLGCIKPFK